MTFKTTYSDSLGNLGARKAYHSRGRLKKLYSLQSELRKVSKMLDQ